jgi:PIN domain nuclease of toxin-antitoxin system
MRLLLDTHVFLWVLAGSRQLKAPARQLLDAAEVVYVSSASIWEVAIKARLGKIDADPVAIARAIEPSGFEELPITSLHAAGVVDLPNLHQDPFDRLLIAQSLQEPLRLLTADDIVAQYGGMVLHTASLR